MSPDAILKTLHASLDRRFRPEEVADLVGALLGPTLSREERDTLELAARGSALRTGLGSSMSADFARPVGMQRQLVGARYLLPDLAPPSDASADDPDAMLAFLTAASSTIHKTVGRSDFTSDRLDRARRTAAGLGTLSKRRYNKLFRLLRRMEAKRGQMIRGAEKRFLTQASKARLACRIPFEEFSRDANGAAFIAYLTARLNLRSVFSGSGQQHAYDEIADMLFRRCAESATTSWWPIAHVHPVEEVVWRLSGEEAGRLVGEWFAILEQAAGLLREVWRSNPPDRETMVVRRGDDSSTWNTAAGAWNKARDAWIAVLTSLGWHGLLDGYWPGKVPRLVAADVAAWHRSLGHDVGPDVKVWRSLPLPWEVLSGEASCPRRAVEAACASVGVYPAASGWTGPRAIAGIEPYRPTPELVHGVSVASPRLASALRRAGWFSGRPARSPLDSEGPVLVFRDEAGFALGATETTPLDEAEEADLPRDPA